MPAEPFILHSVCIFCLHSGFAFLLHSGFGCIFLAFWFCVFLCIRVLVAFFGAFWFCVFFAFGFWSHSFCILVLCFFCIRVLVAFFAFWFCVFFAFGFWLHFLVHSGFVFFFAFGFWSHSFCILVLCYFFCIRVLVAFIAFWFCVFFAFGFWLHFLHFDFVFVCFPGVIRLFVFCGCELLLGVLASAASGLVSFSFSVFRRSCHPALASFSVFHVFAAIAHACWLRV